MEKQRCDLCGDRGADGDPVMEYDRGNGSEYAHLECADNEGWED